MKHLRVLARPPVAFYLALAGGVAVHRQPDLGTPARSRDPRAWALLDLA